MNGAQYTIRGTRGNQDERRRRAKINVPLDPKPCPTCYAPMRHIDGVFRCEKHGEPKAAA